MMEQTPYEDAQAALFDALGQLMKAGSRAQLFKEPEEAVWHARLEALARLDVAILHMRRCALEHLEVEPPVAERP